MTEMGRRAVERYAIVLPAELTVLSNADAGPPLTPVRLKTKNISSSGAFFTPERSLCKGTLLNIDLTLPFRRKNDGGEETSGIRVKGKVVRVEPCGVAVRFAGQYHFTAG